MLRRLLWRNSDGGASDSVGNIFDDLTCLYGNGNVLLKSGAIKLVQHVFFGDEVAIDQCKYFLVFMFPHRDSHFETDFSRLRVCTTDDSNNSITFSKVTIPFAHAKRGLIAVSQVTTENELLSQTGRGLKWLASRVLLTAILSIPEHCMELLCGMVWLLLHFCLQLRSQQVIHLWHRYVQHTGYVELTYRRCFETDVRQQL